MDYALNSSGNKAEMKYAMDQLQTYLPMSREKFSRIQASKQPAIYHPDLMLLTATTPMFKDWDMYFDKYVEGMQIHQAAHMCGLKIKKKHTIIEPWPTRVCPTSAKLEFDVLRASGTSGYERYMELDRAE
jgi:hypothetical protein